jgi:hypothetical protein
MIVATLVLAVLPCAASDVVTLTAVLEENGAPLDRDVSAAFVLWDAEGGGATVWSDEPRTLTVVDGVLAVELGSVRPLPAHVFAQPMWLEVIVEGQSLEPRVRITSAPHALEAKHALSADTCSSLDGLAADDVVTRDMIDMPVFARPAACGGGIAIEPSCVTVQCAFIERTYFDCIGSCAFETPQTCTLSQIGWLARP